MYSDRDSDMVSFPIPKWLMGELGGKDEAIQALNDFLRIKKQLKQYSEDPLIGLGIALGKTANE